MCARLTGVVSQQPRLTNVQSASARQDVQAAGSTAALPLLVDVGISAGRGEGVVAAGADDEPAGPGSVACEECCDGLPTSVLAHAPQETKATKTQKRSTSASYLGRVVVR